MSELLRPALELAVAIARRDAAGSPPVEPPRRFRPFLDMRRLSKTALAGVRRAVDESPDLLARLAEVAPVESDAGGRASWLFLHRPEGWEDELAGLEAEASTRSAMDSADAEERTARRRLRVVEAELARVTSELMEAREARASLDAMRTSLVDERAARAEAETELAALHVRTAAIERERDAAHRRASAADKARAELAAARDDGEVDAAARNLARLERDMAAARSGLAAATAGIDAATAALETGRRSEPGTTPTTAEATAVARTRTSTGPVRLPAPLAPGMFDDDAAVAGHLVRQRGAVLLVDGYNASLRRWPDLPLAEQRARLVDALGALSARVGVEVEVVFDGDGDAGGGVRSSGGARGGVRVTFTPGDVEADAVLLDLVVRHPISRPVVVATDDRRVRREAASRGANVVSSTQLFVVLGLDR